MALTRNIRRLGWFCKSEIRCIRKYHRRTYVSVQTNKIPFELWDQTENSRSGMCRHMKVCTKSWFLGHKKHKHRQHRNQRLETPKESCFRFPTRKAWFHKTKNLPSLGITYAVPTKAAHAFAIKICVEIQWVCLYRWVSGWQKQLAGFLNSH